MASAASDLLDHFRLEAEVFPTYTSHVSYRSNRAHGTRKERIEKRWYKDKVLGHGSFGEVCLEVHRHGDSVVDTRAVKKIDKTKMRSWKVDYERELLALAKFSKAQYEEEDVLVKFLGFFENIDTVFLVMEYFPNGDLAQYLENPMKESEVKQIATDLLEGLRIIHAEGFTHRDLKPQNIFVVNKFPEPWWVKIGDFGIAKRVNEQTDLRTWAGTPHYQAPEISGYVEELEETSIYTSAVDMWSLGCVIYTLSAKGEVPFRTSSAVNRYCNGRQHFPEDALSTRLTSGGVEFVKKLLVPLPCERMTAETALQDPWLHMSHEPSQRPSDFTALEFEEAGVTKVHEAEVLSSKVTNNNQDVSSPRQPGALKPCTTSWNLTMPSPTREIHEELSVQAMEPCSEPLDSWCDSPNSHGTAGDKLAYKGKKKEPSKEEGNNGGRKDDLPIGITWGMQRPASTSFRALSRTVLPPHVISAPDVESREAILLLKDAGFDYSAANYDPKAAWFWAAQHGHDLVVRLLLEKGADIDGKDAGLTALHHAVKHGHEAVTHSLLEMGADTERKNARGLTALHAAASSGNEIVARMLLEKGANTEGKGYNEQTALHLAAQYGHETVVLLLLEKRADIERKDVHGQTALHHAVDHGHEAVIHVLLEKGAEIEGKDNGGRTALHVAARTGNEAVSQLLLEKGADIATRDGAGKTPSTWAVEKWQKGCSVVKLLQSPQWGKSPR